MQMGMGGKKPLTFLFRLTSLALGAARGGRRLSAVVITTDSRRPIPAGPQSFSRLPGHKEITVTPQNMIQTLYFLQYCVARTGRRRGGHRNALLRGVAQHVDGYLTTSLEASARSCVCHDPWVASQLPI